MPKINRFVTEYASFRIKQFQSCAEMKEEYREEIIKRINRAVEGCKRGFITVNEAMNIMARPWYSDEDYPACLF